MLAVYVLAIVAVAAVNGYPTGAPSSACDTMTPMHSTYTPQPTASPFNISLSSTSVAVNGFIQVTLQAADGVTPFQGFLLKGLKSGQTTGVGGTFLMTMVTGGAMPCQYLDCSNVAQSALTHVDSSNKTVLSADWSSDTAGKFKIAATVVQTYSTFWVEFLSDEITVS